MTDAQLVLGERRTRLRTEIAVEQDRLSRKEWVSVDDLWYRQQTCYIAGLKRALDIMEGVP